ncbi:MAG: hypothetical protein K0Q66_1731 [Chitinophagaceae bacterium]|jgi:hypothetical protein|nr:hypothetical protein [Chitinophagaceae bacterium]
MIEASPDGGAFLWNPKGARFHAKTQSPPVPNARSGGEQRRKGKFDENRLSAGREPKGVSRKDAKEQRRQGARKTFLRSNSTWE